MFVDCFNFVEQTTDSFFCFVSPGMLADCFYSMCNNLKADARNYRGLNKPSTAPRSLDATRVTNSVCASSGPANEGRTQTDLRARCTVSEALSLSLPPSTRGQLRRAKNRDGPPRTSSASSVCLSSGCKAGSKQRRRVATPPHIILRPRSSPGRQAERSRRRQPK